MSTADQNTRRLSINQQIQQKLEELAELVAKQEYGEDGPGKDLTFREIEEIGHQVGQLAAQKFESAVTERHQQHFAESQPCPQCGRACSPHDTVERRLVTRLGPVKLSEIRFHCNACRRSFFPSAISAGPRRAAV